MRSSRLRLALIPALALVTSCVGSPALDPRFVALHNTMTAIGMVQSGSISEGSLPEGGEAHFEGMLQPGQCYTIVGLGSGGVANLDVVVLDEGGNEIAHDTTEDGSAAAQFCPQYPGNYRISVRMRRGSGSYIVTAWSGTQSGGYAPSYPSDYGYATPPTRPPHGGPGTCDAPDVLTLGEPARGDTTDGDAVMTGSCITGGTAPGVEGTSADFLHGGDDVQQRRRCAGANVDDVGAGERARECEHVGARHIGHGNKVPGLPAVALERERPALTERGRQE